MVAELLYQLVSNSAQEFPQSPAIKYRETELTYLELEEQIRQVAAGLHQLGLRKGERVAIYLPKSFASVVACFAVNRAGGIFIPVNPLLKSHQLGHILQDCSASYLITSSAKYEASSELLSHCKELRGTIITDMESTRADDSRIPWQDLTVSGTVSDVDMDAYDTAAILYTSGSTGLPTGVVLSNRNLVYGAISVSTYLENTASDNILSVLPFSFDYGFNQLTTAFLVGAKVTLMDYLLPYDVVRTIAMEKITGLAGVPSLWIPLARQNWPGEAVKSLRYITNSGGSMPQNTLQMLSEKLPTTRPFLMYGLTEAFRSTYLPPEEVENRPGSIGKAIPNAEILVVRPDGSLCAADEEGELVHCGPLVAKGYWNNPERTAEYFRPVPTVKDENAVWSGDIVRQDEDGYIYFISRKDDMIKTSGYRVSPTEVEEIIHQSGMVAEVVCFGIEHPETGQAIVAAVCASDTANVDLDQLQNHCRKLLPNFMVPAKFLVYEKLPLNPHGKFDRRQLASEQQNIFRISLHTDV